MAANNSEEPFFHRRSTHRLISELAVPEDWTIYLGSGATIDRTGLSWWLLVDRLLARFEVNADTRLRIIGSYGELRTATMIHQLYSSLVDGEAQLYEDIRRLLYGGHSHMNGQMLGNIVDLAVSLVDAGKSVTFVTPNYDDYLAYELVPRRGRGVTQFFFHGGTGGEEEIRQEPAPISCHFMHGFLPRADFSDEDIRKGLSPPVFSEPQYFQTYDRSLAVLTSEFADRNVMLVGTSLVDAPLVNALIATKNSGRRRYAILPKQSAQFRVADGETSEHLVTWNTNRLRALNVIPVYPDYFGQSSQLVHEVQRCLVHGDREAMTKRVSPRRYGSRLVSWWNAWKAQNVDDEGVQSTHHELLLQCARRLRAILEAPVDENLKLEIWVRWYPDSSQQLGLWASSVGTWPDSWSMRLDKIAPDSRYRSVRVFCNGAPMFLVADPKSDDRWRSYLATPIWYVDQANGDVPVGVISLASMREAPVGSVGPHNLAALDSALEEMRQVGAKILAAPTT